MEQVNSGTCKTCENMGCVEGTIPWQFCQECFSFATLKNGLRACSTFPYDIKYSDGSVIPSQFKNIVEDIENSVEILKRIATACDIVIVPFMLISRLEKMGIRGDFQNVVAEAVYGQD